MFSYSLKDAFEWRPTKGFEVPVAMGIYVPKTLLAVDIMLRK